MPELPEVEVAARNVRRWTAGRRLQAVELLDPRLLHPSTLTPTALEGAEVQRVWRRAKLLLMQTSAGALVWQFSMTGKVVPAGTGAAEAGVTTDRVSGAIMLRSLATLPPISTRRGLRNPPPRMTTVSPPSGLPTLGCASNRKKGGGASRV